MRRIPILQTAIMEAIESFHGKKTLVIIAHAADDRGCDIIYKVDNGKIVETTLAAEEHLKWRMVSRRAVLHR